MISLNKTGQVRVAISRKVIERRSTITSMAQTWVYERLVFHRQVEQPFPRCNGNVCHVRFRMNRANALTNRCSTKRALWNDGAPGLWHRCHRLRVLACTRKRKLLCQPSATTEFLVVISVIDISYMQSYKITRPNANYHRLRTIENL